jgi:excisionase family DNA binding protein
LAYFNSGLTPILGLPATFEVAMGHHFYPKIRPQDKLALRVNEASVVAGISRSTIYALMAAGKLRTTKVGGRRLIPYESLQKLLCGTDASNQAAR